MHDLTLKKALFYLFFVSILNFLLIFFSYRALNDIIFLSNDYHLLIENWNQDIITDIQQFSSDCPKDYEKLVDYQWPGTNPGCNCLDITPYWADFYKVKRFLSTGYCTFNQTEAGCADVHSWPSQQLHDWWEGRNWCLKRAESINFLKAGRIMMNGSSCPPEYIVCGVTTEPEGVFCMPTNGNITLTKCPISGIVIAPQNHSIANTNESHLFRADVQPNLYLHILRDNSNNLPLSEFRVTQGKVCRNNKQINILI